MCKVLIIFFLFALFRSSSAETDVTQDIAEIRQILQHQGKEINILRNENILLKKEMNSLKLTIKQLKRSQKSNVEGIHLDVKATEKSEMTQVKEAKKKTIESRPKRLLLTSASPSVQTVAFYAYLAHNEPSPSVHHVLIFDKVVTNIGDAYNNHVGSFVSPSAGMYVFTWTLYVKTGGKYYFDLIVNENVIDSTHAGADTYYTSSSGTVVVQLNYSDSVFLRSGIEATSDVLGDRYHKSTFAGWKIN